MRVYIAGPMPRCPQFNYPAFHQAATLLRAAGHIVINPAENPAPACGSWLGCMRMSVAQVASVDCLVMLPGWPLRKGARIEYLLAKLLELGVTSLKKIGARA